MNFQNLLDLQTALRYFREIGFENIRARLFELTDILITGLKKLLVKIVSSIENQKERSAIIVFSTTADNRKIVNELETKGIYSSLRDGNIRVSVNIFNNFAEMNRLLSELKAMLA